MDDEQVKLWWCNTHSRPTTAVGCWPLKLGGILLPCKPLDLAGLLEIEGYKMAHGELRMTKDEMREGFASGRTLIQEEWAHPNEIKWVDELITEGACTATPWEYKDNFQCERRRITGVRK